MSWFMTGTDTGAGKTYVTCGLLHALAGHGCKALAMKPLAAGLVEREGRLINEDVALLRSAMGPDAPPVSVVNPYALSDPTAPHIAASRAGIRLELRPIHEAYAQAREQAEIVLVEGVGGWCLPLNESQWLADIPKTLGLPVLLVAGIRLGALNHTLLTARAIEADGCVLDGWIANMLDPGYAYAEQTVQALVEGIGKPPLAVLRWREQSGPSEAGVDLVEAARWLISRRTRA